MTNPVVDLKQFSNIHDLTSILYVFLNIQLVSQCLIIMTGLYLYIFNVFYVFYNVQFFLYDLQVCLCTLQEQNGTIG
jgi:hypothetical protein